MNFGYTLTPLIWIFWGHKCNILIVENLRQTKYGDIIRTIHSIVSGHKDPLEMWYYIITANSVSGKLQKINIPEEQRKK